MDIIPLQPVPNQMVTVQLGDQVTQIRIFTTGFFGMFCDMSVNDNPVFQGVACQNRNPMKRGAYLPFVGNLMFFDTQGKSDPIYTGLGGRFQLGYFSEDEAAQLLAGAMS